MLIGISYVTGFFVSLIIGGVWLAIKEGYLVEDEDKIGGILFAAFLWPIILALLVFIGLPYKVTLFIRELIENTKE
jgi:hypothetical protein